MWLGTFALAAAFGGTAHAASAQTVPFEHWAAEAVEELRQAGRLPRPQPFPDVPSNHWAFNAVEKLRRAGIMIGYPDGTFSGSAGKATAVSPSGDPIQTLIDAGIIIGDPSEQDLANGFGERFLRALRYLLKHPEAAEGPPRPPGP